MCGGGSIMGSVITPLIALALAPETGGASLAMLSAAGAIAGDQMVDKPAQAQQKALEQQQVAATQAQATADKQATLAEQANNKANAKSPDVSAMISANQQSAKAGASGTMLTGPSGIDPSTLNLGKNTLLGA